MEGWYIALLLGMLVTSIVVKSIVFCLATVLCCVLGVFMSYDMADGSVATLTAAVLCAIAGFEVIMMVWRTKRV